jgi:hypothetical protein
MNKKYLLFFLAILLLPCASAQVRIQLGEPYTNIKDYSVIEFAAHSDYYTVCSLDKTIIPVLIKNENNFSDVFTFNLDKDYASLPVKSAVLESGTSAILPVAINPPFGVEENTSITLEITTKTERLRRGVIIKTDIENCYNFNVQFEPNEADLCGCDKEEYGLSIENSGRFSDTFSVVLDAPPWVNTTLTNDTVKLTDGQRSNIILEVNPPCETEGDFEITAKATSEKTGLAFGDTLALRVATQNACYYTILDAENVDIDYFGKNTAIRIENKGIRDSSYSIKVEGIDWYELSQTNFSVRHGEEKTINLALIPGENIVEGEYNVNIVAMANGQEFSKPIIVKLRKKGALFGKFMFYLNYYKYYILLGLIFVVILIVAIIWIRMAIQVRRIRKKEQMEEEKAMKMRLKAREKAKKGAQTKMVTKKAPPKREPKSMHFIVPWVLYLVFLAVLVGLGALTYKYKENFESFWNTVLGFLGGFKDYAPYLKYLIIGVALLIIVLLVIDYFRKKPKRVRPTKPKVKKTVKKAEKKVIERTENRKMGFFGYFYIILVVVLLLAIIGYAIFQFFGKSLGVFKNLALFFKAYYVYFGAGIAAIIILIIIIWLLRKEKRASKSNRAIKNILIIVIGLVILSGLYYGFVYYNLFFYIKDLIILYYPYVLMGAGILVILILILQFHTRKIS